MFEYDEDNKEVLKKINLYLNNKNMYDNCKKKIKNINPKFIIGDIKNIKLERNYDNIWLSNLGQYLEINELKKIIDNLFSNLNEEGKMLVCYLYQTIKDTKYQNVPYQINNIALLDGGCIGLRVTFLINGQEIAEDYRINAKELENV